MPAAERNGEQDFHVENFLNRHHKSVKMNRIPRGAAHALRRGLLRASLPERPIWQLLVILTWLHKQRQADCSRRHLSPARALCLGGHNGFPQLLRGEEGGDTVPRLKESDRQQHTLT